MNEPQGVLVNFASAYIYMRFNQNYDEKSYTSATIEAVRYLLAVSLLTSEQRQWRHDVANVQSDCRES